MLVFGFLISIVFECAGLIDPIEDLENSRELQGKKYVCGAREEPFLVL